MRFSIVGTGRCGSTLLWRMMNLHPQVFVFRETHWIPKMYEFFGTGTGDVEALISIVQRTRWPTGEVVTSLDVESLRSTLAGIERITVANFCNRVGSLFAAHDGKVDWADKTPDYGPYMAMLQTLWPRCRFVHLIRDGVAVAASMSRHPGFRWLAANKETWWCPPSFNDYYTARESSHCQPGEFVMLWYRRLLRTRDESTRLRSNSYLEVRFEELLAQPVATLQRICAFVDLSAPKSWTTEARATIDFERFRCRDLTSFQGFFRGPQKELLKELGYSSSTHSSRSPTAHS